MGETGDLNQYDRLPRIALQHLTNTDLVAVAALIIVIILIITFLAAYFAAR